MLMYRKIGFVFLVFLFFCDDIMKNALQQEDLNMTYGHLIPHVLCRCLGALPWQHRRAQANAESMGFDLHVAFHQHDLKRPALKPTQPEGIGHEVPFVIAITLWLANVRARDAVRESAYQVSSLVGLRADQTRVMKWDSAVIPSKPAAVRRLSMSSPM